MKLKLAILSLAGFIATSLILTAQETSPPATNAPATIVPAPAVLPPGATLPDPAPTNAAPVTPANPPAEATVPTPPPAPATNAPDSTPQNINVIVASSPSLAQVSTNNLGQRVLKPIIPSVIIEDTSLTDAIKYLARQAGINYLLDPALSYGVPGPNGAPGVQPVVSFRLENVTADQALGALLNNYSLMLAEDPKTGISRITKKDTVAPPLIEKIIQLKYAYATNIVISVQALIGARSKVIADSRTSQLLVLATEPEMAAVDELVGRFDMQTRQVLIEARIIETQKNPISAKGIDWTGTLGGQRFSFGNGNTAATTTQTGQSTAGGTTAYNYGIGSAPVGSTTAPYVNAPTVQGNGAGTTAGSTASSGVLSSVISSVSGGPGSAGGLSASTAAGLVPSTAFLNADGVSAVLSFLNTDNESQTLSTPRAVTLDNEEAILSVITAQPIFQITPSTANTPGSAQIVYTNVGTILKVLPRISANNSIALKVTPEVSLKQGQDSQTVNGAIYTADIFSVRRVQTQVLIPSGNTLVMGGLVLDNPSKVTTKVPILGDIPLLGYAFHSEKKSANKDNLLIFVTPTIVETNDFQPTKSTFLKTKMSIPPVVSFDDAMSSSERKDWSNLGKKKPQSSDTNNIMDTPPGGN